MAIADRQARRLMTTALRESSDWLKQGVLPERVPDMAMMIHHPLVMTDRETDDQFFGVVFVAICETRENAEQIAKYLLDLPEHTR